MGPDVYMCECGCGRVQMGRVGGLYRGWVRYIAGCRSLRAMALPALRCMKHKSVRWSVAFAGEAIRYTSAVVDHPWYRQRSGNRCLLYASEQGWKSSSKKLLSSTSSSQPNGSPRWSLTTWSTTMPRFPPVQTLLHRRTLLISFL